MSSKFGRSFSNLDTLNMTYGQVNLVLGHVASADGLDVIRHLFNLPMNQIEQPEPHSERALIQYMAW